MCTYIHIYMQISVVGGANFATRDGIPRTQRPQQGQTERVRSHRHEFLTVLVVCFPVFGCFG